MKVVIAAVGVAEISGWPLQQPHYLGATQNEYTAWTVENPRRFSAMSITSMEEAVSILEEVVRNGKLNYDDCGHRNPDLVDFGPRKSFAISLEEEEKMNKDEEIPKIAAMVVHLHEEMVDQDLNSGRYLAYLVTNPEIKVVAETEEEAVKKLNEELKNNYRKGFSRKVFTISFADEIVSEVMEE